MRTFTKFLIASASMLGVAGATMAAADRAHVMNVALPDGSIAQIHYVGDAVPRIAVAPAPEMTPVGIVGADPFALFDRISLAMDRQMATMLDRASMLAAGTPDASAHMSEAALQSLPPGTVSYSYTSYSSGNGAACSQSVQVTALGKDQPAKIVRQSQGDCTAMTRRAPTPAVQQAKPAAPALTPVSVDKAIAAAPVKGPVI